MKLVLSDSRRLTGGNLYWDRPSAVLDVEIDIDAEAEAVIRTWQDTAHRLLQKTGMAREQTCFRQFEGGANLLVSAPIDALYAMCELNEVAWAAAAHACGEGDAVDLATEGIRLQGLFEAERHPRLLQLQQAARDHNVPFLWDDDHVSLGYGTRCLCWPQNELPDTRDVDWNTPAAIPLALVTGTNGKSTTVRMVASIMAAASVRGGLTSTDFIRVGDEVIEQGDYSGTGGARQLLRHPEVEMAVLEVARGGLLRRGLAVERADAALITNVAADHLGEYGINTVAELIEAKFIVHRAISGQAPLILNADDPGVVAYSKGLREQRSVNTWWFSLDSDHPLIRESQAQRSGACWMEGDDLYSNACPEEGSSLSASVYYGQARKITSASAVAASRQGLLRHNIQNALGATLVSLALGLPDRAIQAGLAGFRGDESDNPGRGNWFEHRGIKILVDFAHNEHGLEALMDGVRAIGADRVVVLLGQAGDRSDEAIRGLSRIACSVNPARLLVCEFPGYERGRAPGGVPDLICAAARDCGVPENHIERFSSPAEGAKNALQNAREGDLLVLLALMQREKVLELVHEYMGDSLNG